jgi:hypothetical protein
VCLYVQYLKDLQEHFSGCAAAKGARRIFWRQIEDLANLDAGDGQKSEKSRSLRPAAARADVVRLESCSESKLLVVGRKKRETQRPACGRQARGFAEAFD